MRVIRSPRPVPSTLSRCLSLSPEPPPEEPIGVLLLTPNAGRTQRGTCLETPPHPPPCGQGLLSQGCTTLGTCGHRPVASRVIMGVDTGPNRLRDVRQKQRVFHSSDWPRFPGGGGGGYRKKNRYFC